MDLARNSLPLGKRPALVVVDMINGFTDPECPLGTDCPDVVLANMRLLSAFRQQGLPIYFTAVVYDDERQAPVFRNRIGDLNVLQKNSTWVHVDRRLEKRPDEPVIEKHWPSSFFKTDLAKRLEQDGADSLVVTGLTTSGCVRATVVDGLQYDYPVFVVREAVGDRNPDAHAANLFDMHAKYADVVSLADLIPQLQQDEQ